MVSEPFRVTRAREVLLVHSSPAFSRSLKGLKEVRIGIPTLKQYMSTKA